MDPTIAPAIAEELFRRWNEPHRRHHNQQHLDEVLAALQTVRADGLDFAERPVVLAAWFHDAIYQPLRADNEQASADLARELLADDPDRDEVARLVVLTAQHRPEPGDRNGIALSDADFAVLGSSPERYDEYALNVREEFHQVPDDLFRSGRSGLLAEFLERDHIFASAPAHQRWEAQARANIGRELVQADAERRRQVSSGDN
ncbi:MAG: hypothetical protein WAW85_09540 [Gordonia sp. (in: high G+C Gram-positive bacteria)]|uniref:HD domain-containing protein n=1 Tax=Gordonia sp. (in: high G+C Gram-positive bacteria) TaxID=84139 RepID=UPI003BB6F8CC